MPYCIDQSIKIEDTSRTTYVCLANDQTLIASISAKEKRVLKLYFRELDRQLIFRLFTFSVLCATLIFKARPSSIIIDKEYHGHEINIKSFIVQILLVWNMPVSQLHVAFEEIGKGSTAHIAGYKAFRNKEKGEIITAKKVLILYNLMDKA